MYKVLTIIVLFFINLYVLHANEINEWYYTAYTLKQAGNMHEAIEWYEKILAQQPNHVHAHIGLAQAQLATGDLINGFQQLEWRLGKPPSYTKEAHTYLCSHERLDNKIILLRAEWGMGDLLQMLRYAKLLKERGAKIKLAPIHERLIPLLKLQPYLDEIISRGSPLPPFHIQIPIMSLPMVFETTLKTIPAHIPYLTVEQQRIDQWDNLFDTNFFNIGICWHGNIIHDEHKFMPLKYFLPLTDINSVNLYSLQQYHGLEQLADGHDKLHILPSHVDADGAFLDTAAIMMHLDLIITVDTAIAHVAGALGKPVWLIVSHNTDWRWLQNRYNSPWYPTMRIFRQQIVNDWKTVGDQLYNELEKIIAQ